MKAADIRMAEIQSRIIRAHSVCVSLSQTNYTLPLFLMHELMFFFLTAQGNIIIREHRRINNCYSSERLSNVRFGKRAGKPIKIGAEEEFSREKRILVSICTRLSTLIPQCKRIYFGNVSFRFSYLLVFMLRNYALPVALSDKQIFFERYHRQLEIVRSLIGELCEYLDVSRDFTVQVKNDFDEFISRLESKYFSTKRADQRRKNDLAVIGSPGKILNRAIAHFCKQGDVPIVGTLHGSESGSTRQLSWGFDDFIYSDDILGYGAAGELLPDAFKKFYGFEFQPPRYYKSTCPNLVERRGESHRNSHLGKKFSDCKVLYIARRETNTGFINPEYLYDPLLIYQFKRELLGALHNVDLKIHPKEVLSVGYGIGSERIISGSLPKVLEGYDCVILDYCESTAFAIVASSDLPIILLNSSYGGLTSLGESCVSNRSIIFDIDPLVGAFDAKKLLNIEVKRQTSKEFTEQFSTDTDSTDSRERILSDIILRHWQ
ncbi:hypothetical protein N8005_03435 [Litorivicinus sp.]|nr:hypothetical protein [Litorivicinus sp.]